MGSALPDWAAGTRPPLGQLDLGLAAEDVRGWGRGKANSELQPRGLGLI